MATVTTTIDSRTFLDCVQRITGACGEVRPGSLVNPNDRVYRAMVAVNNACERIWSAARWPFKVQHAQLDLADEQMWYELPVDFEGMHSAPRYNANVGPLEFYPFDKLTSERPELRIMPAGSGQTLATISQHAEKSYFGTPEAYTFAPGYIGFFPIPDEDFVGENVALMYAYRRLLVEMADDGDLLDLPKTLWHAHYFLSLGEYKQTIEYADYANDIATGERLLREVIATHGLEDTRTEHTITDINYNE